MEETFDYWLALGLLAFLCPEAPKQNSAKKHYKAKGFVVFCWFFFGWCALNKTKQQNNKTTNNNNNNNNNNNSNNNNNNNKQPQQQQI